MRDHSAQYLDFFVDDEFEAYLLRMASPRCWGDELTLQSVANAFSVKINLVTTTNENWYLNYEPEDSSATVVRECFMSYLSPIHYNTIQLVPTLKPALVPTGSSEGDSEEREVEQGYSQLIQHSAPPPAEPFQLDVGRVSNTREEAIIQALFQLDDADSDTEEREVEVSSKQHTQHSAPPAAALESFVPGRGKGLKAKSSIASTYLSNVGAVEVEEKEEEPPDWFATSPAAPDSEEEREQSFQLDGIDDSDTEEREVEEAHSQHTQHSAPPPAEPFQLDVGRVSNTREEAVQDLVAAIASGDRTSLEDAIERHWEIVGDDSDEVYVAALQILIAAGPCSPRQSEV
jgi:hypothetical protein